MVASTVVHVASSKAGRWRSICVVFVLAVASPAIAEDGETLYRRHCATCHQADGAGFAMVPSLANNPVALGDRSVLIDLVLLGRGSMPAFAAVMSNGEVATLLSHVRSSWGNQGSAVSTRAVAEARSTHATARPIEVDLPDDWFELGEAAYQRNCAACHQASGAGIPGAFPALAENAFVQGNADELLRILLNGRAGMPAFGGSLGSADIALIASYVRNAWENEAHLVDADMVEVVRGGGDLELDPTTPTFQPGAGQ